MTLLQDKTIKRELRLLEVEREKLHEKYKKDLKDIQQRRWIIQDRCAHSSSSYHPDPSGNNDSETTCDVCGKVL